MKKIKFKSKTNLLEVAKEAKKREREYNIKFIDVNLIIPNPNQPRKIFSDENLNELAASIRKEGVLQPILLNKTGDETYELVAGERRWRAAKLAELVQIPALVREATDEQSSVWAIIENVQRENLNPLEEALGYKNLIDQYGYSQQEVAELVGKSRPSVANFLRLLNLTLPVQNLINQNCLEMGHARSLLSLEENTQIDVAMQIVEQSLSVRQAENLVRQYRLQAQKQIPKISLGVQKKINRWCSKLYELWDNPVDLRVNEKGKGRIVIHVKNGEEIDEIIKRLSS